jgi:hypothetical protein
MGLNRALVATAAVLPAGFGGIEASGCRKARYIDVLLDVGEPGRDTRNTRARSPYSFEDIAA